MPDVDSKLVTALRQAKTTPMFYVFVAKGANDGALIVAKKKIAASEVNEAKQSTGGKQVFQGRCFGEGGTLVFELAKEPPGTLAKQLKTVIQRDAGMTLPVETRMRAETEEENEERPGETEGEVPQPPPAPPAPPAPDAQRFANRLKALMPVMQTALATSSPLAEQARAEIAAANKHYVAQQYEQANAGLDKAETLIKQAFAGGAKTVPPPPDQAATRYATRLKVLAPVMQKAETTGTEQAKSAKLKIGEANKLYVAKLYDQANVALDEAEKLIKEAFAAGAAAKAPTQPPDLKGEWERRVAEMEPRVLEAKRTRPEQAKWMTLFMSAQDLGEGGKFPEAIKILDQLDQLLAVPPPPGTPPTTPSGKKPTGPRVKPATGKQILFRQSILDWDAARKTAAAELAKLQDAIRNHPAVKSYVNAAEVLAAVDALPAEIAPFDDQLRDALDEAIAAGSDQGALQKARDRAVGLIDRYRQTLNGNKFLSVADNGPFGSVEIYGPLASTLELLASRLKAL